MSLQAQLELALGGVPVDGEEFERLMLSSVSAYSDGTGDDIPRRERTEPILRPPGAGAYRDAAAFPAPPPPGRTVDRYGDAHTSAIQRPYRPSRRGQKRAASGSSPGLSTMARGRVVSAN